MAVKEAATSYSRRSFVGRLGLFCCALPVTSLAQQVRPHQVRRIGFLSGAVPTLIKAFEDELRRLGHIDGHNLIIERRISRPNSSIWPCRRRSLQAWTSN